MPPSRITREEWRRKLSRALIVGPPNSWKTSSLHTWPRPMGCLFYPGEQGVSSLAVTDDIVSFTWENVTGEKPGVLKKEIRTLTLELLTGKHGPIQTFAGDGLHKLYDVFFEAAQAEIGDDEKHRGRVYGAAHDDLRDYLRLVCSSTIPKVVFTVWDGQEKDNPNKQDGKGMTASRHLWPELPGKWAKQIVGEFGVVFYAQPGKEVAVGKMSEGTWQTRPKGGVWGCGIKLPIEVSQKVSTIIPQNWAAFERLVGVNE